MAGVARLGPAVQERVKCLAKMLPGFWRGPRRWKAVMESWSTRQKQARPTLEFCECTSTVE